MQLRRVILGNVAAFAMLCVIGAGRAADSIFDDDWVPPTPRRAERPAPPTKSTEKAPRNAPAKSPPDAPEQAPAGDPRDGATAAPHTGSGRRPIPPQAQQAGARQLMREIFAKEIADRSLPARRALARRLLAEAERAADKPVDQYVLLGGAYEAAREADSLPLLTAAADGLAAAFEVDALRAKADASLRMKLKGDSDAAAARNVRAGLALVRDLVAADDYASAARLCTQLQGVTNEPVLKATARKRGAEVQALRAVRDRLAPSFEMLHANPDDAAANLAVGTHLALDKGAWPRALPMLAKGSDAALGQLAASELADPDTSEGVSAVADGWWDAAARQRPAGRALAARAHAAELYRRVLNASSGLRRVHVERRLAEYAKLVDVAHSAESGEGGDEGWVDLFDGTDVDDWGATGGADWAVEDELLVARGGRGYLWTDRKRFDNFRIRAEAMVGDGGNGGLFLRNQPRTANCYEVDIEGNAADRNKTGSIFVTPPARGQPGCVLPVRSAPAANRWFTVEALLEGYRLTVWVDGKKVAAYEDPLRRHAFGEIGLQHISGGLRFRRIQIRELPAVK